MALVTSGKHGNSNRKINKCRTVQRNFYLYPPHGYQFLCQFCFLKFSRERRLHKTLHRQGGYTAAGSTAERVAHLASSERPSQKHKSKRCSCSAHTFASDRELSLWTLHPPTRETVRIFPSQVCNYGILSLLAHRMFWNTLKIF